MFFPTTLLLATLTSLVSALPAALEPRQAATVIRFYTEKDFGGTWADMGVEEVNVCQNLPTSVKDSVSSFKIGVYKCRFFEHDGCTGKSQWFDEDWHNMRAGGGNYGYDGSQNDEISSAICST